MHYRSGSRALLELWLCSAAAVVRRLSAAHTLPAPDVAEALMLHLEACMPSVSRGLVGLEPKEGAPVQEQRSSEKAPSSNGQGAAEESKKAPNSNSQGAAEEFQRPLYQIPVMQGLGQSWQALADLVCKAGGKAVEAGVPQAPYDVECHDHLALGSPVTSAAQEWNALEVLLESRAWWWDKAVFDAHMQACFLVTDQAGMNAACAMAIVSDFMLREQSKLEGCASLLRRTFRNSQTPIDSDVETTWPQRSLTIAAEVLAKLK